MKLFYAPASPFARKVVAVAHELGLFERLTIVPTTVSPLEKDKLIAPHNPAGKIPTLITEKGEAIFDSRVICDYLDALAGGNRMIPAGDGRWKALVLQSLADEALDALLLARYESVLRPEGLRWTEWTAGQMQKALRTLDTLEADWVHYLSSHVNVGVIAAATLPGYLDFRFAHVNWREGRPHLAAWFDGFSKRESMVATFPKM